jgi:hypothetical protein
MFRCCIICTREYTLTSSISYLEATSKKSKHIWMLMEVIHPLKDVLKKL